jgi:hypothetical protein
MYHPSKVVVIFALVVAVLLLVCVDESHGYSVTLDADHEMECYFHEAAQQQPSSGTFEVISGDTKELIVTVIGPPPKSYVHYESKYAEGVDSERDLSEGAFDFAAEVAGHYKMCFERVPNAKTDITVAFNFRVQSMDSNQDYEYAGKNFSYLICCATETDYWRYLVTGLNAELAELQEGLYMLRDHLSYMSQREDAHRNALGRIDVKVLCWSILESAILVGMAVWQIGYIGSFFEIKRFL